MVCLYRNQLLGGKELSSNQVPGLMIIILPYFLRPVLQNWNQCPPVNFRSLILSCFQGHGGAAKSDEMIKDHYVVYVEISRDTAADVLTVRVFLQLVQDHVHPGTLRSPKCVVVSGDQSSYKYFAQLWLESWGQAGGNNRDISTSPALHEWLLPFPGFSIRRSSQCILLVRR